MSDAVERWRHWAGDGGSIPLYIDPDDVTDIYAYIDELEQRIRDVEYDLEEAWGSLKIAQDELKGYCEQDDT